MHGLLSVVGVQVVVVVVVDVQDVVVENEVGYGVGQ